MHALAEPGARWVKHYSALVGIKLWRADEGSWVGVNNSRFSDTERITGGRKEMNRLKEKSVF